MNLTIITVGNKPNKWELEEINHYIKQLKNHVMVDFINIKGQQNPKRSNEEVIKLEADLISKKFLVIVILFYVIRQVRNLLAVVLAIYLKI